MKKNARSFWYYRARLLVLVAAVTTVLFALAGGSNLLAAVLSVVGLVMLIQASLEVWRMLYSYRTPEAVEQMRFPEPSCSPTERFGLIVAARFEEEVYEATLLKLAEQTHPDVVIFATVCHDDPGTTRVAKAAAAQRPDRIEVLVYRRPKGVQPSKPLQLNYAFECMQGRGITVVGVFDAEDTVAPELFMHVDAAFRDPGVGIVQGGVQLMNLGQHLRHWFCLHNCLEYWKWFSNVMKFQADHQFVPLGGNTVFVRYEMLQRARYWLNRRGQQGPWPISLTEDCALGVLLCSLFGARVATYYDPNLVTQEETPDTIDGLFNQRVRWIQGFHRERRKRLYEQLPTLRQRLIALYILGNPVFQAFSSLMIPVTLYTAFRLKAPVGLVMLMYLPLIPLTLQMVLNGVYLRDFGKAFDRKIGLIHYLNLIFGHPFYQLILNAAAFWAMYREFRGNDGWYKTRHPGQHRKPQLVPRVASEGA